MINLARKFFQLSAFCQTFVHTEHTSYTAARFYAKFNNVTAPPSFSCTSTVTNLFQPPLSLRFPFFRAGMAVSVRAGNSVAVIQGASDAYVPSVRKIHHFLYLISELFKPVRKKKSAPESKQTTLRIRCLKFLATPLSGDRSFGPIPNPCLPFKVISSTSD